MEKVLLSVSDFVALTNQTLEYAFPGVAIEGEVSEYKISQGKWIFFKLKDEESAIDCFLPAWQLRVPIEEGMKVVVQGSPKLTKWGRFSVTVQAIRPSGEGAIKKSFELLKAKLEAEGLFAPERKRPLPTVPQHIAVISSTEAAGYADFIKILNDRWGGMQVEVAHVQVQGDAAPDQMIRALQYFNEREETPEVIVLIRGGGSADDLAAFNDEQLVRAIAASRVPTMVGVGHEVDVSLADYAADVRAATPSNAAQLLVPDRRDLIRSVRSQVASLLPTMLRAVEQTSSNIQDQLGRALQGIEQQLERMFDQLVSRRQVLAQLNPETVLARGYALLRGQPVLGETIEVETARVILEAEVKNVRKK
jgi:exodeoxyribonuclease VII large subunit